MSNYYVSWLLQTIAMLVTALVLPGLRVTSILGALAIVLLLAFVNASVWDAALFFQIPDSFSAHTILLLLSNGILFWILVKILPGIESRGLLAPILAPVLFTLFSVLIDSHARQIHWARLFGQTLERLERFRDTMMRSELSSPVTPGLMLDAATLRKLGVVLKKDAEAGDW